MRKNKDRFGVIGASLLALGAAYAPAALAQTTPSDDESAQSDEEIVVVGSRIHRDNFNTAAPVQLITPEETTRAGFASTAEVLQSSSVASTGPQINNLYAPFVVNGGGGVNTVGLRGLAPTQTLVLLNGRRLSPAGVRGAVGAADLNTIPSALLERIEILKDGASSIYGSDAVAGVINIVTRHDLNEFTLEGQRNFTEQSGGEQTRLSLSGGHVFGDLSLSGSIEYFEREALTYGDRDFLRCPGDLVRDPVTGESFDDIDPLTGQPKCWTLGFANSVGVTINTIGTRPRPGVGGPGAPAAADFFRWRPNSFVGDGTPAIPPDFLDGFEGVNGGGLGFANRDLFDPRMLDASFISPTRNTNLFLSGTYDLPGDHELYGEVLISERESSNLQYLQLILDYPNNALLPAELQVGGPALGPQLPNPPPTNVPLPALFNVQVRGFIGTGNILSAQDVSYDRFVAGMRGDFIGDWRYDVNIYYGRNDSEESVENFLTDRVFNSVVISPAVGGEPANLVRNVNGVDYVCTITLTDPSYGCIPAPTLNTQTVSGQLPGDYLNWIRQTLVDKSEYEETSIQAVFDGPLFTLPAGEVQAVFGVEYRNASIDDRPDFNSINRNVLNFTAGPVTQGEDSVTEAFMETEVPLLADSPLAQSLTLNLSGRYTDYDSVGSAWTYKAALTWEPIENLMFRATTGTSFRAPALYEQYLGLVTGFLAGTIDPCSDYGLLSPTSNEYQNCDAEIGNTSFVQNNGVTVFSGGGGVAAGFKPETSDNYTVGLVWRPIQDMAGPGDLSVAIDRFNIEVSDEIAQAGAVNILNQCYGSPTPAAEPLCTFVARDPLTNNLTVTDLFFNLSKQGAEGWDYAVRYARDMLGGQVTLDLNMTQYTSQPFQLLSSVPGTDTNGRIGYPDFSGDLAVNYTRGPWNVHYDMTWLSEMDDYDVVGEDPTTSFFVLHTDTYYLHNASIEYHSDDNWRLIVGVRNMFDEQPPRVSSNDPFINGHGATPIYSGLDYLGRQYFVNLATTF